MTNFLQFLQDILMFIIIGQFSYYSF